MDGHPRCEVTDHIVYLLTHFCICTYLLISHLVIYIGKRQLEGDRRLSLLRSHSYLLTMPIAFGPPPLHDLRIHM